MNGNQTAAITVLGGLELDSVAAGYSALDAMVKEAPVEVLEVRTVCPGKYLIFISGSEASVEAAVAAGTAAAAECLIDRLYIARAHRQLWAAMSDRTSPALADGAVGILESYTLLACIDAADAAAKAAAVELLHIRWGDEMGGKASAKLCGPIYEIEAAVESGARLLEERQRLCRRAIIARPDESIARYIGRG